MQLLEGCDSKVSAGGSLANTLVGLGQLAAAQERTASSCSSTDSTSPAATTKSAGTGGVRVGMTGCVGGSDALGEFARAQLQAAGVDVVGAGPASNATGVVMSEDSLHMTQQLQDAAASARLLLIEGYMWETEGAAQAIPALVRHARSLGTLVALTAGDAGVVERHGAKVLEAIAAGADIWFGNEAEAAALVQHLHAQQAEQQARAALEQQQEDAIHSSCARQLSGMDAALQLASACPMVVVTDGSRGSYITALGQLLKPPVDTCGAGDAYAAGLLYGFLCGLDLHSMGHLAAKTASAVISKHGPQLSPEDAEWVVAGLQKQSRTGAPAAAAAADPQQSAAADAVAAAANATAAVGGSGSAAADVASRGWNGGGWAGDWARGVLY
ncbi:Ribokinase-like protein [Scenedesmus sp. NREL 46B-D3]|nr:Ribokinase-like protein [Scenedesmus sp. NREL 46B-D3]